MVQRFTHITLRTLTMAAAMIFFVSAAARGAEDIDRSFDMAPGGLLELETDAGSIDIRTDDKDSVRVSVERSGKNADDLDVSFEQSGNKLKITGDWNEDKKGWWGGTSIKVRFKITLPREFDLDLSTSGGSISVSDLNGELRAHTSGGSLRFGQIEGQIKAHTSGGSIQVAGGGAKVDVHTSGGSIDIGDVSGPVVAKTSGGSISIDKVSGSIDASTSGGSVRANINSPLNSKSSLSTSGGTVHVTIAKSLALDIDAVAGSGGVRSEIPVDGQTRADRKLRGSINGGGVKLSLRSGGGGIRIYED